MIIDTKWRQFDDRAFSHQGVVIDIGCAGWKWCKPFAHKKRVVGYDPQGTKCPAWAELRKVAISISKGAAALYGDGESASLVVPGLGKERTVPCASLHDMLEEFGEISVLKMNIEGSEYALLMSLMRPPADQLAIAFHDQARRSYWHPKKATQAVVSYLSEWYVVTDIYKRTNWKLFVLK